MRLGQIQFDLGTMTIACVLILLAVLAANGRLQNIVNAWNGSLGAQASATGHVVPKAP